MDRIPNFVGGDSVDPVSGDWLDNVEPAVGRPYSRVADSDERDVERAVAAARAAFSGWASTPAEERSRLLLALADRIEQDL